VSLRDPRLTLVAWGALAAAAVVAAVGAEAIGGPEMPERAGDLAAGLALLGGGAVAWARRPRAGAGPLMLASGLTWFAGDVWSALLFAHRGPLVHLVLTYPGGRTSSRVSLLVIAGAYVDGLIPDLARSEWATLALTATVLLAAAAGRRSVGGVERRARTAGLAAAALLSVTLGLTAVGRLLDSGADAASVWVLYGAVTAIACGLTADLLWGRWVRAALTDFVIDLGDHHEPQALRAALARALGDPSLELAYRIDGRAGWVDEAGRSVALPDGDGSGDGERDGRRAVTSIGEAGAPLAALVHDPATLADPELLTSVAAAARLAVANVRLQAEIAGRLDEMAASRRRLMEAGDEERRRLGERLGDGPEARLAEVAARLERLAAESDGDAEAILARLTDEVATSRAQLRDLAHGIRPRTLSAGGLRPALAELAGQSTVPVDLAVPDGRFAPPVELVAYFVCSEALANIAKHADAARVRIDVAASAHELRILVADDGVGGADVRDGAGLRGLADRVEALAGSLTVESPVGGGTRVEAILPTAGRGTR
jgi:signal transduction histidine kinase